MCCKGTSIFFYIYLNINVKGLEYIMKRMKAIFVSREGPIHNIINKAVLIGSDSDESFNGHVAVWFEEVIDKPTKRHMKEVLFEAHAPMTEFVLDGTKYDKEEDKYVLEFGVPDELYDIAVNMALRLEHRPYGLTTDCLATMLKERFNMDITDTINCEDTVICSEAFVRIINAMFENYLEGENLNSVSPHRTYHTFLEFIIQEPRITLISSIQGL